MVYSFVCVCVFIGQMVAKMGRRNNSVFLGPSTVIFCQTTCCTKRLGGLKTTFKTSWRGGSASRACYVACGLMRRASGTDPARNFVYVLSAFH
jgi:hypothetical protein